MTVAVLPLCRELYELSEYAVPSFHYTTEGVVVSTNSLFMDKNGYTPAYDLNYVLQAIVDHSSLEPAGVLRMLADNMIEGESFADGACRLAISLLKSGVLERAG